MIIDDGNPSSSSRVAAGLINPIVPKGVRKTWMCDEILTSLVPFYRNLEARLEERFFRSFSIYQIHPNEHTAKDWSKRAKQLEFENLLSEDEISAPEIILRPHGNTIIRQAGRLNTKLFLSAAKKHISKNHDWIEGTYDYSEFLKNEDFWQFRNHRAKGVIFCEGIKAIKNPWFNHLHFHPTGGDILKVRIPADALPPSDLIYKKRQWLIPVEGDFWLAGSNFHKNNLSETPVTADCKELTEHLAEWVKAPLEVVEHHRGVRPTVEGRRPYLGEHHAEKGLFIYNGLGSKGSSLICILSPMMKKYLLGLADLNQEVDIRRYSP